MAVCHDPHSARIAAYSLVKTKPEQFLDHRCYVTIGPRESTVSIFEVWATPESVEVMDRMTSSPVFALPPFVQDMTGSYPLTHTTTDPKPPK